MSQGSENQGSENVFETLRRGFDQAITRQGDEMTRRRVWSKVATPPPVRRRRTGVWFAGGALALAGTGALAVFLVTGRPTDTAGYTNVDRVAPVASQVPHVRPLAAAAPVALLGPAEVRTGAGETLKFTLAGGARIALDSATHVSIGRDNQPVLHGGRVSLEVPKQAPGRTFEVAAGPYRVRVVGTRFHVSMSGPEAAGADPQVAVEVDEGSVEVRSGGNGASGDRTVRIAAGQTWTGRLSPSTETDETPHRAVRSEQETPLPPVAAPDKGAVLAEEPVAASGSAPPASLALSRAVRGALAAGEPERALELLGVLARRTGPAAENAVYESGLVLRDRLRRPREAIEVWQRYRDRFPGGMLRAEVDLSIVETLARLGAREPALAEAEAFLERHPHSERRAEVVALAEALREGRAVKAR